jgi:hypothetical protein
MQPEPADLAASGAPGAVAMSLGLATCTGQTRQPAPVLIGLTSIRGREGALKRTLDALLAQTLPGDGRPVELHLFLSREPYLLDRGFKRLPGFLRRRIWRSRMGRGLRLQVHWTANIGPYRKLLPLLERLTPEQQAADPLLITADDDTLYPPTWLQQLVAGQERFGCVVAFRGRRMVLGEQGLLPYRQWIAHHPSLLEPSLFTVPTGKDGICYRLSQLDWRVMDHRLALEIAGHADDLWFKAHALLTNTPAVLLHQSLSQQFPELTRQGRPVRDDRKQKYVSPGLYLSINKQGGNDVVWRKCLEYVGHLSLG